MHEDYGKGARTRSEIPAYLPTPSFAGLLGLVIVNENLRGDFEAPKQYDIPPAEGLCSRVGEPIVDQSS